MLYEAVQTVATSRLYCHSTPMPGYIDGTVKDRGLAALAGSRPINAPVREIPDSDTSSPTPSPLHVSQSSDSEYVGKAVGPSGFERRGVPVNDFATDEVGPRMVNDSSSVLDRPNLCRRWVPPSCDDPPRTRAPMTRDSDQNFAGPIPRRGTDLVVAVPRNYALAIVFFVFLVIIWYLLMNRGN